MRAAGHWRIAIADGPSRKTSRERNDVAADNREHCAELQHSGGVQNILSRRAKMDVAGGFIASYSAQLLDDRSDRIANSARAIGYVIEAQIFRTRGASNRIGDRARDNVQLCLRACQCGLDIEHELQMSVVGEQHANFVRAIERAEHAGVRRIDTHAIARCIQTSKKTVSSSVCNTISNRNVGRVEVLSICAIRVDRRSIGTAFSKASLAFDGSSGK